MLYNRILVNVVLPIGDFIFESRYKKSLIEVEKTLGQDRESILEAQRLNLKDILTYACKESEYYRNLRIEAKDDLYSQIKAFPILTKEIIRSNYQNIITQKSDLIKNSTSGSSGIQTEIYIDKKEQSLFRAIQTTWWKWAGYKIGAPMFQTGLAISRSLEKRLKDFFFRTHYQFAFGLSEINTEKGLNWALKSKPFLGGYASSLHVLSELAENKGIRMKSAVSWGDKLFDHYRKNIERVFGCKVYETYGTGEGLMLGAQKDLDYLYIMDPYFVVELLDDEGNDVKDGEIGHVVVTSLIHKVMPLIRYKVGDLAIKLPMNQYPQHRELGLSLFQKIIGRETDIVETPFGKKLIVHSFTGVFEYFPEIKQFQVVQRNKDLLIVRYVVGDDFKPDVLDKIKNQLDTLAEESLNIDFLRVDEILPSKSGKPQIVIKEN
jgi:phenylacetate-CoA ligase